MEMKHVKNITVTFAYITLLYTISACSTFQAIGDKLPGNNASVYLDSLNYYYEQATNNLITGFINIYKAVKKEKVAAELETIKNSNMAQEKPFEKYRKADVVIKKSRISPADIARISTEAKQYVTVSLINFGMGGYFDNEAINYSKELINKASLKPEDFITSTGQEVIGLAKEGLKIFPNHLKTSRLWFEAVKQYMETNGMEVPDHDEIKNIAMENGAKEEDVESVVNVVKGTEQIKENVSTK